MTGGAWVSRVQDDVIDWTLEEFHDAQEPLPPTTLGNVVLTPHIGWPTDDGYRRFAAAACDVLLDYLARRPVPAFEGHWSCSRFAGTFHNICRTMAMNLESPANI